MYVSAVKYLHCADSSLFTCCTRTRNIVADARFYQFSREGNMLRTQILLLGNKKYFSL